MIATAGTAGKGTGFKCWFLHADPGHEVLYLDRDLERAAVDEWLRRFSDRSLSLTDAVSFEVMSSRRIRQALALDDVFAVAGFERRP